MKVNLCNKVYIIVCLVYSMKLFIHITDGPIVGHKAHIALSQSGQIALRQAIVVQWIAADVNRMGYAQILFVV